MRLAGKIAFISGSTRGIDRGPMHMPGVLTRLGVPSDIAHAAVWLAADESEFVTGSEVTADGGQSINGVHS